MTDTDNGRSSGRMWLAVFLLALAGCRTLPVATSQPTTQRSHAEISLDQLFGPAASTMPATMPSRAGKVNTDAMLAYMQGRSAMVKDQYDIAIEHLKQSLEHDQAYLPAGRLLTKIYFDQGRLSLAGEQATALLEHDPGDITAHYVLGTMAIRSKKDIRAAGRHLYQAITLAEQSGQGGAKMAMLARSYLGQALASRNYLRAAIEVYQPLLKHLDQMDSSSPPRDRQIRQLYLVYRPALTLLVADFWCKLKHPDHARRFYVKAQRFPAVKRRARVNMIRCYHQNGRHEQARNLLDQLTSAGVVDETVVELYQALYPQRVWLDKLVGTYNPSDENVAVGVTLSAELMKSQRWADAVHLL